LFESFRRALRSEHQPHYFEHLEPRNFFVPQINSQMHLSLKWHRSDILDSVTGSIHSIKYKFFSEYSEKLKIKKKQLISIKLVKTAKYENNAIKMNIMNC
jgi:hypothetical protein